MKRPIALLLVLVMVMAAQGAPENDEPTRIEESECYDCHQTGGEGSGPVLTEIFRMFMTKAPNVELGESTELEFRIMNWWTAEMRGFEGYIDLTEAPAFSFEPARDPVSGSREGTLPEYDADAFFQGESRSARIQLEVEAGGTELTMEMTPEEGSDADLTMNVWTPAQDPDRDTPQYSQSATEEGGNITITISGELVQGGTYVVEAVETPNPVDTPSTDMFDAEPFRVDWTLSFEFDAGDPIQSGAVLTVLDGQDDDAPQDTTISWAVNVVQEITTEQRIRVYMESVSVYEHPPQFRAVDEWLYWNDVVYLITPQEDGSLAVGRITPDGRTVIEFIVGESVIEVTPQDAEGPDLTEEVDPPFDIAAEVLGYIAAFLLVMSLLTGGAFGNWSRRIQQFLVYGRSRKRVAFHNVISYGVLLVATVHMILFLVEPKYDWSVGFFLGGVSILGMYMSGITGLYQRVMVRGMGHEAWRWLHFLSFVFAFAGAAGHIVLDGIHFAEFQSAVGWEDPVAPALNELIPPADPTGSGP